VLFALREALMSVEVELEVNSPGNIQTFNSARSALPRPRHIASARGTRVLLDRRGGEGRLI
jgi:hypothetical protein